VEMQQLVDSVDSKALKEVLEEPLKKIRFPIMKMQELAQFVAIANVVDKTLMVSIYQYVGLSQIGKKDPKILPAGFPFALEAREPRAILLKRVTDFDKNGFFYAIATKNGSQSWRNPHGANLVRVSVQGTTNGNIASFVENVAPTDNFYVNSGTPNWIQVDCLENWLMVTHYTVRHNSTHPTNYIARNWKLEGSEDGKTWEPLKSHVNDQSLQSGTLTASFEVQDCRRFFSKFRITQTGNGSDNTMTYLMMNGMELYGRARFAKG